MQPSDDLSSLERMRRRLYAPSEEQALAESTLAGRPVYGTSGWKKIAETAVRRSGVSPSALFLIAAAAFFVIAFLGAGLLLFFGGRSVSANNIVITTTGPTSVGSGDTVPLSIVIENRNPVAITDAQFTISFPEDARATDDAGEVVTHHTESLGTIPPGGKAERTVRTVIFGSENQRIILPVKLEYHTDGATALFVKEKEYGLTITTSPLSVRITTLAQVSSGQPITVRALVRSNANTALANVAVLAEYPFGFAASSVDPASVAGNLFVLGTLLPGEERTITITGVIAGENQDERVFRFSAGTLASPEATTLGTPYTVQDAAVAVAKPFIATTLSVNRDTSDSPTVEPGTPATAILSWANTTSSQIQDAQITVRLVGDALDPESIVAGGGFYRSSDRTIVFSRDDNPGLANLEPGDTGQGSFTFAAKSAKALAGIRNPAITLSISVAGRRVGEQNVLENLSATITRSIKVGTDLAAQSRALRTTGPFKNIGPWPPEADTETTYTIGFTLANTVSGVADAVVSGTLPSYVRFTGTVSPNDGSLKYDDATRTVVWNAGDIPAGASAPRQVFFQLALLPSASQRGTSPILMNAQSVSAVDRFTQKRITGTLPALSTELPNDPAYTPTAGNVK